MAPYDEKVSPAPSTGLTPTTLPTIHEIQEDYFSRAMSPKNQGVDHQDFGSAPTPALSRSSTLKGTIRTEWCKESRQESLHSLNKTKAASIKQEHNFTLWQRCKQYITTIRWKGVLAMTAGVFAQSLCWGLIMTYGTILSFYVRYLIPDVCLTLVVLAGAIPPFCLLALALPWGRLLDAGHHRLLNIAAGVFATGGMVSLAFTGTDDYNSGSYPFILLASMPMGIGQSIYFLSAPQMAKTWHPQHKGLAMGITNSGAAVGGTAWPLIFTHLVEANGFREGIVVLAGITAALAIFIAIFAIPAPDFKPHIIGKGNKHHFRTWWPTRAFKSRVFVVHVISMCFVYSGILTVPFIIELWARRRSDVSTSEATTTGTGINMERSGELSVYLVIALNACQLPGRLFGSTMCDKWRARKIHAAACFAAVIIIASDWFTVSTFEGGLGFAALFGLVLGVMVSLPINDVQDMLGNQRTYLLGQYAGAVYMCAAPFIMGGALIAGTLVEEFDVYVAPGVWCMACFFTGGILILVGVKIKDDTACFEEPSTGSEYGGDTRVNSMVSVNASGAPDLEKGLEGQTHVNAELAMRRAGLTQMSHGHLQREKGKGRDDAYYDSSYPKPNRREILRPMEAI